MPNYATYFLLCALQQRGVDAVFEQQGARRRCTDFRRGQHLGPRDHLIALHKPNWMSQADYDRAPATRTVRELRTGGKILVTTLLCPKQTPKTDLKTLDRSRWNSERDRRTIKPTLGMQRLSCKTPDMALKEPLIKSEVPAAQGGAGIFQSLKRLKNEGKRKSHFSFSVSE